LAKPSNINITKDISSFEFYNVPKLVRLDSYVHAIFLLEQGFASVYAFLSHYLLFWLQSFLRGRTNKFRDLFLILSQTILQLCYLECLVTQQYSIQYCGLRSRSLVLVDHATRNRLHKRLITTEELSCAKTKITCCVTTPESNATWTECNENSFVLCSNGDKSRVECRQKVAFYLKSDRFNQSSA
jgi:hypothetical protein